MHGSESAQVDCERVMHLTSIKGMLTCRVGH
jgi:hypothetical protein